LQKDKQQLEKVNQDLSQHSTNLQADIAEKDLEIEGLKKELASHQIDEEQRKKIQAELNEMILKRGTLAKEAFLHSPLYEKMQVIIKDCQDRDESNEEISDQEWQEFVAGMDMQWNNAITDLCVKYQLAKEELHLVCLRLAGFPFSHLEYLLHLSRRTLYRKKNALLKRMGAEQNCEFEDILQKKIGDGTLVTHFVCTDFRNLATIKQKSDAYEKGIIHFIFIFVFYYFDKRTVYLW